MSCNSSDQPTYCSSASPELKLYQAFIFSVSVFFTFILLLLFCVFYLRRRSASWQSMRTRASNLGRGEIPRVSICFCCTKFGYWTFKFFSDIVILCIVPSFGHLNSVLGCRHKEGSEGDVSCGCVQGELLDQRNTVSSWSVLFMFLWWDYAAINCWALWFELWYVAMLISLVTHQFFVILFLAGC